MAQGRSSLNCFKTFDNLWFSALELFFLYFFFFSITQANDFLGNLDFLGGGVTSGSLLGSGDFSFKDTEPWCELFGPLSVAAAARAPGALQETEGFLADQDKWRSPPFCSEFTRGSPGRGPEPQPPALCVLVAVCLPPTLLGPHLDPRSLSSRVSH